jgi:2-polyprenyl-3-methyl-5-hydroxy-6-metoxy-1,4-benzoquinol methylase
MTITAIFWDVVAKRFDQQEARYPQVHTRNVENARKYLHTTDLVLDFGCATGEKALELAGHVKKIYGIDISSKMVAAAKRKAAERKIQNIDFVQATIFDGRLEKESFDVILAFGILHLLKDLPQSIRRIYDLLKPGGWFVSSTACMGDNEAIPTWINNLLFIPSRIGLLPTLRFLKISELEESITRARFQIVETETIPFNPNNNPTYIVGRFITAKKEQKDEQDQ